MGAAYRLRIKGFVRYDEGNSLTIEAQGEQDDIAQFVDNCRDWFPPASIEDFIVTEKEPETYTGFTIRRSISEEEKLKQNQHWFQKLIHNLRL
jgi:hydrogenase maturation factor HypF (carbamoyltransferase family)